MAAELIAKLNAFIDAQTKRLLRRVQGFHLGPIHSYVFLEQAYFGNVALPSMARGLFVDPEAQIIVLRVGERPETKWEHIQQFTRGPYEVLLKENGCLILVSSYKGQLIVSSKHALIPENRDPNDPTHAMKGKEWLLQHLAGSGVSPVELSATLSHLNVSAAFELADDDFEEHILEYPPDKRGLYIHALIKNTPELETLPHEMTVQFASKFGFKIVKSLTLQTLDEVKAVLDEAKLSGTYKGDFTEGFVIRCQMNSQEKPLVWTPFMFKCKLDEPYGMFREWRAATAAVLSGKGNTFKQKYALTRSYVDWALRKLKSEPGFFSEFAKHKGIIRARNAFLIECETLHDFKGDFIQLAKESGHGFEFDQTVTVPLDQQKILIVPIAIVGVGKSTLARVLKSLYPDLMSHISSDDYSKKTTFLSKVLDAFESTRVVFADRNNHLYQHRHELTRQFRGKYPHGHIIALQWDIGSWNRQDLIDFAFKRISSRGENHQCLTATNPKIRGIIISFLTKNDTVNLANDADSFIDQVIHLQVQGSIQDHLQLILPALSQSFDQLDSLDDTVRRVQDMVVSKGETKSKKPKLPLYFGLRLDSAFGKSLYDQTKRIPGSEEIWSRFKSRFPDSKPDWHVTLAVSGPAEPPHAQYFKEWCTLCLDDSFKFGQVFDITIDSLVANDRILVATVSKMDIKCANKFAHITIATISDQVKAKESNDLLVSGSGTKIVLTSPIKIQGTFDKF